MHQLSDNLRQLFDALLEAEMDRLPPAIGQLLERIPLVVDDLPDAAWCRALQIKDPTCLCGLHHGIPITRQSNMRPFELPEQIMIFRVGILRQIEPRHPGRLNTAELAEQIRITLLHEIGHHFGLDEQQLSALGYG